MNKQITIILATLMALPLIFAMYGGENKTIEFSFETDDCSISPNITEGINFTFSNKEVLIETAINFIGEYNITCYDWLTKEVETHNSGGSRLRLPKVIQPANPIIEFNITTNSEINNTKQIIPEVKEPEVKLNIFQRFWNWLKGLFK